VRARYRTAESDPLVQDILKRFQAEVVAREPVTRAEWLARFGEAPLPLSGERGAGSGER
jgi:hypothetical protein